MKLIRELAWKDIVGVTPPRYYGVAWADPLRDVVVIAVVPLNRIIQIGRDIGLRLDHFLRADHSWAAAREHAAYLKGFANGRAYDTVAKQPAKSDAH